MKKSFNERVYNKVRKIPSGRVATYGSVAAAVGTKAYRAVGNAMNKNSYAPEVPCHRVISADGSLGGFASGLKNKVEMLKKEGVEIINGKVDLDKYAYKF